MKNKMRPIHPGEILRGELEELNLSASAFAEALSVPVNRITQILNGKRAITADTAIRLGLFFRMTPDFWLDLQTAYDIKIAMLKDGDKINKEVHCLLKAA